MSYLVKSKDSQWLQVEVCRDYQRDGCMLSDDLCEFAHPSSRIEIVDGKVMACYDSCKGRCTREVCKYYHPSASTMEQLLLKGRSNLASKGTEKVLSTQPILWSLPETASRSVPISFTEPKLNVFQVEGGLKRPADQAYQQFFCKRQALEIPYPFIAPYQPVFQIPAAAESKFKDAKCNNCD